MDDTQDLGRFMSPEAFAAFLDVSEDRVRAWAREGRLPAVRLGNITLIPRDALDRLLAEQEERRGGS